MRSVLRPAGTIEKIDAPVTAESSLDGLPVEIALVGNGSETYLAASWVDTPTTSGTARTDSAVTLAVGTYVVRVKIAAPPETIKRDCYVLHVYP